MSTKLNKRQLRAKQKKGDKWIPEAEWKKGKRTKGKKIIQKQKFTKKDKKQQNVPFESKKQLKNDPRNEKAKTNVSRDLSLTTQQQQVAVQVPVAAESVQGIAMSYVTYVLQKGYMANAEDVSYIYYAYVYLIQIMISYMTSGVTLSATLPYWLLCLGRALAPKSVAFKSGQISYTWLIDNPSFQASSAPQAIGPGLYSAHWQLYAPTTGNEASDLFPIGQVPGSYNINNGLLAWQNVNQFMTANLTSEDPFAFMHKQVATSIKTPYDTNVSAFAQNNTQSGGGWNGVGGPYNNLQHEVPIFSSMLSSLAYPTEYDQQTPDRFPVRVIQQGVDALYTGAFLTQFSTMRTLSKKGEQRFHFVDFLEFGDVIAQWVQQLIMTVMSDPEYITAFQTDNEITSVLTCPLTLQEMLLVLRAVVFTIFKDTQPAVQAMYPRSPQSMNDSEFIAYVSSATTCYLKDVGMLLPMPILENLYALKRVEMDTGDVFVPVIGQYYGDQLVTTDYAATGTIGEGTYSIPAFAEGPYLKKRVLKRSISQKQTATPVYETISMVADTISLIDGYDGVSQKYVCINDPTRLQQLVTIWNTWLANSFKPFSSSLATPATEQGILVLFSGNVTRHWVPTTESRKLFPEDAVDEIIDSRFSKKRNLISSNAATRSEIAISSQSKILANPFEMVMSTWILPVNNATPTNSILSLTGFVRYAEMAAEPFSSVRTGNDDGASFAMIHNSYAAKMVHGRTTDLSDWDQIISELAKTGRGGILTGLVADFLSGVVPGMGNTMSSIASMLPI
jgi:hypothetical protein